MKEVTEFIKKGGAFYLGTVDGDQPEIRPIGVLQEYDGKLYTAVGQHKKVYAQIMKNPKIVICSMHDNNWIRLRAVAVPAGQEIVDRVFADNPFLSTIYNEKTGLKLGVLELTDGEVEFCSMMGPDRTEKL
ncbi:MAG: pyridoxamine 5'-phosphate oxidase family protein [Clostridia bacterium]|nr:pyridoxamine 5'-phosphate oxidase family protein [Clostridia bacterium]